VAMNIQELYKTTPVHIYLAEPEPEPEPELTIREMMGGRPDWKGEVRIMLPSRKRYYVFHSDTLDQVHPKDLPNVFIIGVQPEEELEEQWFGQYVAHAYDVMARRRGWFTCTRHHLTKEMWADLMAWEG